MPFSESLLDILLLPITVLGFWIAFRQNEEDKIRKSRKPDLMNLMNFIYENHMKFSYLFDLREHDLIHKEISRKNADVKNELYVSFDDFNLNYIVSSSQIPDYTIELDKFATESKGIYEMALKIKQYINQYNKILTRFCEDIGKCDRNSIDDFRNIFNTISEDTFLSTFELYNNLQHEKSNLKVKLIKLLNLFTPKQEAKMPNCKDDLLSFKQSRERLIYDRLKAEEESSGSMWMESKSLGLLRSFMCIPYKFSVDIEGTDSRKQHRLLYHTLLINKLPAGDNEVIYNRLIKDITKYWINSPKGSTHFFVCDYITTINEFLTYSSLKSKYYNCRLNNVYEHSKSKKFVGARDLTDFINDIRRLGIFFNVVSPNSEIPEKDCDKYIYIKTQKNEESHNYMGEQKDNRV